MHKNSWQHKPRHQVWNVSEILPEIVLFSCKFYFLLYLYNKVRIIIWRTKKESDLMKAWTEGMKKDLPDLSYNLSPTVLSRFFGVLLITSRASFPPRSLIINFALSKAVRLEDLDLPLLVFSWLEFKFDSLSRWLNDTGYAAFLFSNLELWDSSNGSRLLGMGVDGDDQEET